jgi:hypothetical protein
MYTVHIFMENSVAYGKTRRHSLRVGEEEFSTLTAMTFRKLDAPRAPQPALAITVSA